MGQQTKHDVVDWLLNMMMVAFCAGAFAGGVAAGLFPDDYGFWESTVSGAVVAVAMAALVPLALVAGAAVAFCGGVGYAAGRVASAAAVVVGVE